MKKLFIPICIAVITFCVFSCRETNVEKVEESIEEIQEDFDEDVEELREIESDSIQLEIIDEETES